MTKPIEKNWDANLSKYWWKKLRISQHNGRSWGLVSITSPNVFKRGPNCITSWRNGLSTGSPSLCILWKLAQRSWLIKSGETEDSFLADIALWNNQDALKLGIYGFKRDRLSESRRLPDIASYIPFVSLPRCLVNLPKPPKETGDCMPLYYTIKSWWQRAASECSPMQTREYDPQCEDVETVSKKV